ncbi:MAG: ornithine carbamoyltransferase [Candidatus Marsarchaeota archaeon]|nr:ornithine carbamoyltransferase [Candidatus Marsarchaeota archaeon]
MNIITHKDLKVNSIKKIFEISDNITLGKIKKLKNDPVIALFFAEASTRTRVSFEVAAAKLGCKSIYIDAHTSQASRGEELADTAKILSLYCDYIVVRINEHDKLEAMANAASIPVINALTHLEHPTQALADCYTIKTIKKDLKGLKISLIGDIAQNTFNSLMVTAAKLGANIFLVGPKNIKPNSTYVNEARKYSNVYISSDIKKGIENSDIIYTDTFVSMGDEKDAEKRRELFAPYQLNSNVLSYAKKSCNVMHPLPAHRGEEVTANVIDGNRSIIWQQAKNKQIIEMAIINYLSQNK